MPTVTISTPILPVEPLLRAINDAQHSRVAVQGVSIAEPHRPPSVKSVPVNVRADGGGLGDLIRRHLLRSGADVPDDITESLAYEAAERTLTRATSDHDGLLTRGWVDEFCCKYLQVHPCAVYGDAWFDFSEEYLAQGARPDRYEDRPRRTARRRAGEREVA